MWAQRLTDQFVRDGVILPDNAEVVRYGLEALVDNVLAFLLTVSVGVFYGSLLSGIGLWLFVFPLRKYAGGYHARTKVQCYLISVGMLILAFAVLYQPDHSRWTYLAIAAIFGGCIYRNAPIDNENKVLDAVERKVYRKRARIVLGLEGIMFAIAWALGWRNVIVVISMCFGIAGVALMAGKISNTVKS